MSESGRFTSIWISSCSSGSHPKRLVRVSLSFLPRVIEQPLKIPFVAGVVLAANAQKPELAQEVLSKAVARLQEHLDEGAWREVKLILRLLGCLQGILEGDGVFPIFEELFSRAVDLQTASSEDVCIYVPTGGRIPLTIQNCRVLALSSSRSSS